jgi:Protein of unknown function (DUF3501)
VTRAIRLGDVVNFFEYEKVREERRRRVIELKRKRRVEVGPYLSFVFENRETLLFQIQEMCRAERIIDDARVQEEIGVYSALLPRPGELSATLFIEISDKDQIKPVLDRFMGIDTGRHVWMEIAGGPRVPGVFEAGHSDEEKGKLAAVHFVRFAFSAEAVSAFATSAVDLVTDHSAARARARLSDGTKAELLTDLGP